MRRRPSLWLGGVLALALVILQTLGLTHRVAHAPQGPMAAPALAASVDHHPHDDAAAGHHPHDRDRWDALFGHEGAGEDCRLFDQLALADLAPDVLDTSAAAPSQACGGLAPAEPRATLARRAHQARAPPRAT